MVPPSGRLFRTWSRRAAVVPRRTTMTGPDDSQAGLPDLYPVTVAWVTAGAVLAAAVAAAEQPAVSAVAATAASTLPGLRTLFSSMPGSPHVPCRSGWTPRTPRTFRRSHKIGDKEPGDTLDPGVYVTVVPTGPHVVSPGKRGRLRSRPVPARTSDPVHSPSPTRLDH